MQTDPLVVDTVSGRVRGRSLDGGGRLFAGIPFAAPPIGPLRLHPPQPVEAWTGVRDAVEFPLPPPQRGTMLMPQTMGHSLLGESSEDCLYLNVWTPDTPGPHPVLVWIYGGGFEIGSASPPMTDAAELARRLDAVVVAANYRVGALGFLHLADLDPAWVGRSNLGLQDQIAALGWVRDNIAAFDGDPAHVTVAGVSAGAFSIGALLTMPAAAGTFRRAILNSGSTGRVYDAAQATAMASDLLAALGLSSPDDLLTVTADDILDHQHTVVGGDLARRNLPGGRAWGTVLDGTVVTRQPQDAIVAGQATSIEVLVCANHDEATLFQVAQGEAYRPSGEAQLLAEIATAGITQPERMLDGYRTRDPRADLTGLRTLILTDAVYRIPAIRLAAAQVAAGGRAYTSLLVAHPRGPLLGACHSADLDYLFDHLANAPGDPADHTAVRDDMLRAWRSFIATGDPGWPIYDRTATGNTHQYGGATPFITEPPHDTVGELWATLDTAATATGPA
ncbi:carboxylesterase/lipase family protein [Nocardia sp. BMG111209]|uniref:carboxylesterase/lipase family protein n=1 Tax=Nocardia sp. BMG111209 TaxID=1160137 RepID=UPI0003706B6C|nr:carboxylesterase family protein [Nocardia sp. BMG111209]